MTYRLPDHPVIARLEREGWPLEPSDWWPDDEYEGWEDDREETDNG